MLEKIKDAIKKINWWEWIPVFGTVAYAVRVELLTNNAEPIVRKAVKHYKTIFNLISLSIAIVFIGLTFGLRDKHGFGHFPFFFWIGLGIGLSQNITLFIPRLMYNAGIKRYEKKQNGINTNTIE